MNASSYSARYAERKRAEARLRDAQPKKDPPCRRCGTLTPAKEMRTLCGPCHDAFKAIAANDGLDAAEVWVRESAR